MAIAQFEYDRLWRQGKTEPRYAPAGSPKTDSTELTRYFGCEASNGRVSHDMPPAMPSRRRKKTVHIHKNIYKCRRADALSFIAVNPGSRPCNLLRVSFSSLSSQLLSTCRIPRFAWNSLPPSRRNRARRPWGFATISRTPCDTAETRHSRGCSSSHSCNRCQCGI